MATNNPDKINYGTNPIRDALTRYNTTIFIIITTGALIASVLLLQQVFVTQSSNFSDNGYTGTIVNANPTTINYLNKLSSSANNTAGQTLPSGRINPFSE